MSAEEKVLDALESQVDNIEVALDAIERGLETVPPAASSAVRYVRTNPLVFVAVGAVAGAAGALVGYKIAKRKLTLEFERQLTEEIEATKTFYGAVNKTDYATPQDAVDALIPDEELQDAIKEYEDRPERVAYDKISPSKVRKVVEKVETVVTSSVFEGSDWNWEYERAERERIGPNEPYILHFDEFMENAPDYQQNTLTYYVEDDTLADEKEEIIHDVTDTIGSKEILSRFGHGSKDPKTLYIRNERLDLDFEIVMSERSYTQDVLGFTPEDAPPSRRRARRENAEG